MCQYRACEENFRMPYFFARRYDIYYIGIVYTKIYTGFTDNFCIYLLRNFYKKYLMFNVRRLESSQYFYGRVFVMQMISGTVKNAVQLQVLNNKWQQKKESGKLTKEERNARENWTQDDYIIQDIKEQAENNRQVEYDTKIDNKIMAGGTLTPEEEKYLEQNNPEALKKYKEIKAEKKNYEEKLRKCKTKDEVERVKLNTMGEYASSLKKVVNDPLIPKSEKLAKAQEMLAKTNNVQEVHIKFVGSLEYEELPTEGEEAQERAEERQAEYDRVADNVNDSTENVDNEETADNIDSTENVESADTTAGTDYIQNTEDTDTTPMTDHIKNAENTDNNDTVAGSVQKSHHSEKNNSAPAMKAEGGTDSVHDEHEHRKNNKKTYSAHTSAGTSNVIKRTDVIIDDIKDTCSKVLGQSISYTV